MCGTNKTSLGILVKKVQEKQVGDICEKLCTLILTGNEDLKDVYSIGLKTLIKDIPESFGESVANALCTRLVVGVEHSMNRELKLEQLDILADLLLRFGSIVKRQHETLRNLLQTNLITAKSIVKKRLIACLGALGTVLSDKELENLVQYLLRETKQKHEDATRCTIIQTIGTIARTVGHRLGTYLPEIIPLCVQVCGDPCQVEEVQSDSTNDLRENCLQTFESFIFSCPRQISKHIDQILQLSLGFLVYDPNYTYDDEMLCSDIEDSANDDDFMDEDMEDEYSDDDDTSWKVRRASGKVLSAIIQTKSDRLNEFYPVLCTTLIDRFKEREENVRIDILNCFRVLLRNTVMVDSTDAEQHANSELQTIFAFVQVPQFQRPKPCASTLFDSLPKVLQGVEKLLGNSYSLKSRSAVLLVMKELALVAPGKLNDQMGLLVPSIMRSLESDRQASLKLESLLVLHLLLKTHSPTVFHPYFTKLIPLVVACASEEWYKITAQALGLLGTICLAIKMPGLSFDYQAFHESIFEAIYQRLNNTDIDQEIKEGAILAMANYIAQFADIAKNVEIVFTIYMERLQNETTRLAVLKAFTIIASQKVPVKYLHGVLSPATNAFSQFLRQQSRTLKQAAIDVLKAFVQEYGETMASRELFGGTIQEASNLISDKDLHVSDMTFSLINSILHVSPGNINLSNTIERSITLARSPLLQGATLSTLLEFLSTLVGVHGDHFIKLFNALVMEDHNISRPSAMNLAKCVAKIYQACPSKEQRQDAMQTIMDNLCTRSDSGKLLGLFCIGEIGKEVDLYSNKKVEQLLTTCFGSSDEEVKTATAYAFGCVCVGNLELYLPDLLVSLQQHDLSHQYLILSSLKEIISCHIAKRSLELCPHIPSLLPILHERCESKEEGVRNMVAECLGKLAILDPNIIVDTLTRDCRNDGTNSVLRQWTALTALKYCMVSQEPLNILSTRMDSFFSSLSNEDISIRRACLLTLNSAAHHQPGLIQPHLNSIIYGKLLETMQFKSERVVDLGPFKHRVDDGLVLRTAAFSCMDTLLDTLSDELDLSRFLPVLESGLADHDDVRLLCHQILIKLCIIQPQFILDALDRLTSLLEKTIFRTPKDGLVGTEVDRANDVVRNALRVVDTISCMENIKHDRKFPKVLDRILQKERIRQMLTSIRTERGAA